MRTITIGSCFEGQRVVAVCLDDLSSILTFDPKTVRRAVKETGMGRHNKSKDFVPSSSTDPVIRRQGNSHSRKCTVVWLEKLPATLQSTIQQGTV